MSYIVNLDDFKPLFLDCVNKLEKEVGFSLFINPNDLNDVKLQASIGSNKKAIIYYNTVVRIITSPSNYINGQNFNPPEESDYITSISEYFKGNQVSIKIEKRGIWVWKPNVELISLVNRVMPEYISTLREFTLDDTYEETLQKPEHCNEALQSMFKTIVHNIFFYNAFVSRDEKLVKIEYPELSKVYKKLSLDDYYNYMSNVLNDTETAYGFDISFIPWETSLNINVYYNEFSGEILNNMIARNNHIWNPEDKDLLIKRVKKTKDLKIIRKE
jgi:hypothetical protein